MSNAATIVIIQSYASWQHSFSKCNKLFQKYWYKVIDFLKSVLNIKTFIIRMLVDSGKFSPTAISELGLWRSENSHRHYYKISKKLRYDSAHVIANI